MGFWWKPESRCAMPAWILARAEEVSRRSVLAALWYYLLLGDVEANFTRKFSFFSFSFSFFVLQRATISRKVTLSLSLSFFFSFFDTIRSKLASIGVDLSVRLGGGIVLQPPFFSPHLHYCETTPPLSK